MRTSGFWPGVIGVVNAQSIAPYLSTGPLFDVPIIEGLGSVTMVPSGFDTTGQVAQYFAQGFRLFIAADHARALASFRQSSQLAQLACAICHWGEALALGPSLDTYDDPAFLRRVKDAWKAAETALQLSNNPSVGPQNTTSDVNFARDNALIRAMHMRYDRSRVDYMAKRSVLDRAYANEMLGLANRFSADDNVAVLAAFAVMLTTRSTRSHIEDVRIFDMAKELLEKVLRRSVDHSGASILYILLMKGRPMPDLAMDFALSLPEKMPGAPHAVHVASLAFLWNQQYDVAERLCQRVVAMDQQVSPQHYLETLVYVQKLLGKSEAALKSAGQLALLAQSQIAEDVWEIGCTAERYAVQLLLTQALFSRWQDILTTPSPDANQVYHVFVWRFVRCLAILAQGSVADASSEMTNFRVQKIRLLNTVKRDADRYGRLPTVELAEINALLIEAQVLSLRQSTQASTDLLWKIVKSYDQLPADDPPFIHLPPRLVLGAALLQSGDAAGARQEYEIELKKRPRFGWAIFGLREACDALGQASCTSHAQSEFQSAWYAADIQLQTNPWSLAKQPSSPWSSWLRLPERFGSKKAMVSSKIGDSSLAPLAAVGIACVAGLLSMVLVLCWLGTWALKGARRRASQALGDRKYQTLDSDDHVVGSWSPSQSVTPGMSARVIC